MIKPEIGAPGASLTAAVATGDGTTIIGGTSGATPVIAGASALLLQGNPNLTPTEVKARLMTGAETQVFTNFAALPGVLAPISRIGAGEVRVNQAFDNSGTMWDASNPGAVALSFGYQPFSSTEILRKCVVVRNFSGTTKTWNIATNFRYASDQVSGAVTFSAPPSITVPANSSTVFTLTMSLDPFRLPVWSSTGINAGLSGARGELLELVEYDGYVTLTRGEER